MLEQVLQTMWSYLKGRGPAVRQQQQKVVYGLTQWMGKGPATSGSSSNYSSDGLTQWMSRRLAARRQQQTYLAEV